MRKIYLSFFLVIGISFLLGTTAIANIKLPAIFSDKMVLQQQAKVAFWGWAEPGEEISIRDSWSSKTTKTVTSKSGYWKTDLQTPKAGGPYTIIVTGRNTIELKDVLIGEVWVCSGQSNMVFSLKSDADAKTEIPKADYPTIRYFSVERQYGPEPFADCPGSTWKPTTPGVAPSFSAVAYYFAKKIHEQIKVPVGIIYAAWGGTPAEAWTPGDVLKNDPTLSAYFDRWKNIQEKVGTDSTKYFSDLNNWRKDSTSSKKPGEPQTYYYFKRPWREPGVLFNGMINPVIPYGIRGILWYQGESNVSYANEYFQLFSGMIKSWREKWNRPTDIPFYFVQIAPYGYNNLDAAAQLREAQSQVAKQIPNTGMAVTVDVGNIKDIHFTQKKKVGERLALIAMVRDYGLDRIVYEGPSCKKASVKNKEVVLDFGNASLSVDGTELNGFEIGYRSGGSDSLLFVKAKAKVQGNNVIVWSDAVAQPLEVRYAWLLAGEANLMNKEGLPAPPFRIKAVFNK